MDPNIDRMRYHFHVERDLPDLGLRLGDCVSFDPSDAEPYIIHRPYPANPGALLAAMNEGAISGTIPPQLLRPHPSADAFAGASSVRPALRLVPPSKGRRRA